MTEIQFVIFRSIVGIALVGIIATICVSDNRERRIPNKLVLAGLVLALIWNAFAPLGAGIFDQYTPGGVGLLDSLLAGAGVFAFFFVLYAMRVMGAGDVKLMGFFGALFGTTAVIDFTLTVFICGGVLALCRMLNLTRARQVLMNMKLILIDRLASPYGHQQVGFDPDKDTVERLPFALAICSAAILIALSQLTGYGLPWSLTA